MAEIILTETASVLQPAAATVSLYCDTTANPQLMLRDDTAAAIAQLDSRNTVAQVGNKDFTDTTTTISNVSATSKAVKFTLSGMTAAQILTLSSSQSTSQTLTIPNITGADTLMTLNLAQTTGAAKTFRTADLLINNPAATFAYTITSAAIVAARVLNLPLITGTDTLMCLGLAQTVTGILTLTTPAIGAATGTSLAATSFVRTSATTTSAQGIGYSAGGTVTQATSKVTAFTLSRYTGVITFAADALAADTSTAGAV